MNASLELAKMWDFLSVDQPSPISVRAISPAGAVPILPAKNVTVTASKYPCVNARKLAFQKSASALGHEGYNVYIVMNSIDPHFAGNETNGIAVRDSDISARRLLLIDFDRIETSAPATDHEIAEALSVADQVSEYLHERWCITPHKTMSGNGIHLYVPLDNIANDPASKTSCQRLLIALAKKFNTGTIRVDTSVYNASRITKVLGTIARKGTATAERPFRMAHAL